ncbi:hypothetical protein RLON56S_02699 [Alishewanella longhuensis]
MSELNSNELSRPIIGTTIRISKEQNIFIEKLVDSNEPKQTKST